MIFIWLIILWSLCKNYEFCANMFVANEHWLFSSEVTVSRCQVARKLSGGLCDVLANDSLITSVASNTHGQQMGMKGSSLYKQQWYLTPRPFKTQRTVTLCSRSVLCQVHFAEQKAKSWTRMFSCEAMLEAFTDLSRVNIWSAVFSVDHPSSYQQGAGIVCVVPLAACHLWLPACSWSLHLPHTDASQNLAPIQALQLLQSPLSFPAFGGG